MSLPALAPEAAPRALAPEEASVLTASLFLDPRPEHLERLHQAFHGAIIEEKLDWQRLVPAFERHGILCLARRNLELAGVRLSEPVELAERDHALRQDAQRFAFTLEHVVASLNAQGIEPTLLKGASLALDLYADPAWRSQGDLDLLVEPREVKSAVQAAADLGLAQTSEQLPLWWYSLTHFHVRLEPNDALLRPVEIHWALHPPALLYTVSEDALRARRIRAELPGGRAFVLDEIDRLLHLVTHLTSHWIDRPASPTALPPSRLAESLHPVRLKWAVDLLAEVERISRIHSARKVFERALEWNAQNDLSWVLAWIRGSGMLASDAIGWVSELITYGERSEALAGFSRAARTDEAFGDEAAMPAFGFRPSALRRLPRWIWPPAEYIARRHRIERAPIVAAMRVRHAMEVLARGAFALCLLPVAWVGRILLRGVRSTQQARAMEPERILDLVSAERQMRNARGK